MAEQVYDFPTGKKRHRAWPGVVGATISLLGMRQEKTPEREDLVSLHPRFRVGIFSVGAGEEDFALETEGVKGLHALLDLLVVAAHQRGQGLSVTDYTDGVTQLPDMCKPENQEL